MHVDKTREQIRSSQNDLTVGIEFDHCGVCSRYSLASLTVDTAR
jgi:hypothetical protein